MQKTNCWHFAILSISLKIDPQFSILTFLSDYLISYLTWKFKGRDKSKNLKSEAIRNLSPKWFTTFEHWVDYVIILSLLKFWITSITYLIAPVYFKYIIPQAFFLNMFLKPVLPTFIEVFIFLSPKICLAFQTLLDVISTIFWHIHILFVWFNF